MEGEEKKKRKEKERRKNALLKRGVEHDELVNAIIPRERLAYKEHEVRRGFADKLRERAHQGLILLHPPRGVDEQHIFPFRNSMLVREARDIGGVFVVATLKDFDVEASPVRLELLDSATAEGVARRDHQRW